MSPPYPRNLAAPEVAVRPLPRSCSNSQVASSIMLEIDSFPHSSYALSMSTDNELTSMTVSLPATQKAYVKAQATESGCSTPSEYIRRLIHADQRAREQEEFERKILAGLDSPPREMTSDDWPELRSTLRKKLTKRRTAR